jgi:ATP-dependent HslUV protease ATP-binding subunit HslU
MENKEIKLTDEQKEMITEIVKSNRKPDEPLTPTQIVNELDKYIIGQSAAKKAVAIALRNRWRRQQVSEELLREEIMPNNIIMIGPTGVGKTEIARRLARLAKSPFTKVEATKFTEVGYVGRDVESMIRDLVERAVQMVQEEETELKKAEAKIAAENRLLDILIPPVSSKMSYENESESEIEENYRTREKFRKMLREGKLDEKTIEIDITVDAGASMQIMGPFGMDDMGINIQDMISSIVPKKTKKRKMKIKDARMYLEKEKAEKLIDMDAVVAEAISRTENNGIVFIDEIDKIASRAGSTSSGPEVSREGVQRDLLPIVEGTTVNTRYGQIRTDHILFIASGAFHVSKPSDLIPELQGRFPIRVELRSLTEEDFVKILTLPENALIKQYMALMASDDVKLKFDDSAISAIARTAAEVNAEVTNIGARRLHTILTTLLEDLLFKAPDVIKDKEVIIDAKLVEDRLSDIAKNSDLSKFIL